MIRGAYPVAVFGPSTASTALARTPATIAPDGTDHCHLTVFVKDCAGVALAGVTPVVTATGTNNTISGPSESNSSGISTCTLSSTTAETKTVSATVGGRLVAATVSVKVGTVPTITSITPDHGPIAGGTSCTLIGTGFAAGAKVCVMFLTEPTCEFTDVTVVSPTEITGKTPLWEDGVGDVDILVENTDEGMGRLQDGYTYEAT
jgi:hypothetical protein